MFIDKHLSVSSLKIIKMLPLGLPRPLPFTKTTSSPEFSICPIISGSFGTGSLISISGSGFISRSLSSPSVTPSSLNILSSSLPWNHQKYLLQHLNKYCVTDNSVIIHLNYVLITVHHNLYL